jgi:hypothetical protein
MLNNNQKQLKNQRKINPKRLELMIKRKKRRTKKRKIRRNQKIIKQQLLQLRLPLLSIPENITHWLAQPVPGYLGIKRKKKII